MKQAYSSRKYRELIEWIALNDNAGSGDSLDTIAGYLTVTMIAHCYNLKPLAVAQDVWNDREAYLLSLLERR